MPSQRLPVLVATASCLFLVWQFYALLPELGASMWSQFGFDGRPHGSMSTSSYVLVMLVVMGLMAIAFAGVGLVRKLPVHRINVPSPDYWLTPERIALTLERVVESARWMLALNMAFIAGLSFLVIAANQARPARLSMLFLWLLAGYLASLVLVLGRLYWSFRKPLA